MKKPLWLVHEAKSPSAIQRLQLEQLKKQQEEIKTEAFIQKAAVAGGVTILILIGLKKIKKK